MDKIAVIGAGSWGTALAVVLAAQNKRVHLLARNETKARYMQEFRENTTYLPHVRLGEKIRVSSCLEDLEGIDTFVISVPSHVVKATIQDLIRAFGENKRLLFINTAKGFDPETGMPLSEALEGDLSGHDFCMLSGPSHAEEVGRFLPSAVVSASRDEAVARRVQSLFMSQAFRVYTNTDLWGVEIASATKNVMALAAGVTVGLGFGDNALAALVTRGLHEMTRLGLSMGAKKETFYGLAGIGDLMVTCNSEHSRNRRCGRMLAQGQPLAAILEDMGMVVEGVQACQLTEKLSRDHHLEMPITAELYQMLFKGKDPKTSVISLMERSKKDETAIDKTKEA